MTRQTKAWQGVSSATGAVLAVMGAGIVLGSVEHAVGCLGHLLVTAACLGLGALTTVAVEAWHALTPCALVSQPVVEGLFRVLVSSCPAILAVAA